MRRIRKKYKRPLKMFDKKRIEREAEILKTFGLRRKREIWRAETMLRGYRRLARTLAAKEDKKTESELIGKLVGLGVLEKDAGLDNVLALTVESILERRLQTVIFRMGLTNTSKHARQLIIHGHVTIGGRRVIYPSYMVPKSDEKEIKVETDKK